MSFISIGGAQKISHRAGNLLLGHPPAGPHICSAGPVWTAVAPAGSGSHNTLQYGNGLFLLPNGVSQSVSISPDFVNWNTYPMPINANMLHAAIGPGRYVITGDANGFLTSPDAMNWTLINSFGANLQGIAYGGGRWVATIGGSSFMFSSPDGVNWFDFNTTISPSWQNIIYANGLFYICGQSTFYTSVNGTIATLIGNLPLTPNPADSSLVWDGLNTFVLCAAAPLASPSGITPGVMVSKNLGVTWQQIEVSPFGVNGNIHSVIWGNGVFICQSADTLRTFVSPDGLTWTQSGLTAGGAYSFAFDGTTFYAAAQAGQGLQKGIC